MTADVKVLYIAGWARSGSTILDNVLGQVEGFFSGGELSYLWERGLSENRLCGCGVPFRKCETWRAVLTQAYGGTEAVDASELVRLAGTCIRTRHFPGYVLGSRQGPEQYLEALARLYRAIRDTTGSRVIVDSSKSPSYGAVLEIVEGIDLRVVHIVRDPRATAFSWLRRKRTLDQSSGLEYMRRHGAVASSVMWNVWNLATPLLRREQDERYMLLRYEDFVARPRDSLLRILDFMGEPHADLPFVSERTVRLEANHTASGNPNRFRTGLVDLEPDEEWRTSLPLREKLLVTAVTLPVLGRFGYPVRPAKRLARAGKKLVTQ